MNLTKKTWTLLVGGAFGLVLLGSIAGVLVYATFFEPPYPATNADGFAASFSRYAPPVQTFPATPQQSPENLTVVPSDFIVAADKSRPAVVHIRSRYGKRGNNKGGDFFSNPFRDFFDEDGVDVPRGVASGSGVLISADGYIATNNHVIEDAEEIEVTLFDNRTFPAEVIGTDLTTDLALLKIESEALQYLTFANSDDVKVGQWVLAVGNPMDLTSTVTAGIVSAKGRNINLLRADTELAIESFIQTDAAVNKGNSGGALVNLQGDLIGINTAIASRTGYYAGYSFAIPASIARKVVEDLLTFGEVRRGYLGVSIRPVDAELAGRKDLSILKGAYVTRVQKDLGAFSAGLREGDVIVSVNEIEVRNSSELQEQVSRYRPDDVVKVLAYRGDERMQFNIILQPLSQAEATPASLSFRSNTFRSLGSGELTRLGIRNGFLVEDVGEAFAKGGIQDGFVITHIDGQEIRSIQELETALQASGDYISIKGLYDKGMNASYSFSW